MPLTKATVLGGAIVNFVLNVQYRHPIVPSRPLIDYSAALLLQPMALAGTVVGAQLNAMTPSWLLLALLVRMHARARAHGLALVRAVTFARTRDHRRLCSCM